MERTPERTKSSAMPNRGGMEKTRRRYNQNFKISVIAELGADKPLLRMPENMASIRALLADGRQSWPKIPNKHSEATEIGTKIRRRLQNCRGLTARLMPNLISQNSIHHDPKEGSRVEAKAGVERRHMIIQEAQLDGLQLPISHFCLALGSM